MKNSNLNGEKKNYKKKHFLKNSLYCHFRYHLRIFLYKFPLFYEDYLGLNMRYALVRKSYHRYLNDVSWFTFQLDLLNLIIERNTQEFISMLEMDEVRVDDILDILSGHRPSHLATLFDDMPLIDYLIKNDAHLMARDWNGYTPLLKAAALGRLEIVKRLIEAGVPPQHRDPWGKTPLDKAKLYGQKEVVNYLSSLDQDYNREKIDVWKNKKMKEKYALTPWYMRQNYF
jgi:hypothetical protein